MRRTPYMLTLGCSMVLCATVAAGGFTDIAVREAPEHEVRFTSDRTIYVESLQDGRWAGRYWTADGRIDWSYDRWTDDAFAIQVKNDPSAETSTSISTGWKWVDGSEAPLTEKGARHFIVELSNTAFPVSLKVHTLLDGTPILTRWLEIANTSEKPFALTGVHPCCVTCRLYSTTGDSTKRATFLFFPWTRVLSTALALPSLLIQSTLTRKTL